MGELLKRWKFELFTYRVGDFGGGTSEPEYRNKRGEKVPYEKTKWYKLSKRRQK